MKTILFGLGYGIAAWAIKRSLDRNKSREEDFRQAQETDAATAIAKAVGGGTWPLWKTGNRCN